MTADTREIGELQVRAYLAVVGGTFQRRYSWSKAALTIKNSGNSPAYDVQIVFIAKGPGGEAGAGIDFVTCIQSNMPVWMIAAGGEQKIEITANPEKTVDWGRIPSSNADIHEFECVLIYKTGFDRQRGTIDADEAFHFHVPVEALQDSAGIHDWHEVKIERHWPFAWAKSIRRQAQNTKGKSG